MNRKQWIAAVSLVLAAVCFLCACQASDPQPETADDPTLPELKIGVDNLAPFFFTDESGDYAGIDAEIAQEACRRAGYQPVFVEINWSSKDTYLQDGTVDCLWTAFTKNEREDLYQWTDPYLQSKLRIIVDQKSPDQKINALYGRGGVAVRAGSKVVDFLLEKQDGREPLNIYSCGTFEMAETAFVKGYVSSLCCHEAVLEQVIHNYPGLYRFLDGSIAEVDLAVAFSKEDPSDHCKNINAALDAMKKDGTIAEISAKYRSAVSASEGGTDHAPT